MDEFWYLNNDYDNSEVDRNTDYPGSTYSKPLGNKPIDKMGLSWMAANSAPWLDTLGKTGRNDLLNFYSPSSDLFDAYEDGDKAYRNLMTTGNASNPGDKSKGSWLENLLGEHGTDAMKGAYNAGHLGLSAGQLGLGIASYLQQSKYLNKQNEVLDQQIASNRYNMDRQKASDEANQRSYEAAEARRYGPKPTATA